MHFNPRSLAGATLGICKRCLPRCNFNPRSLAGATLGICKRCLPRCNFNPRSLAGATHTAGACITFQRISIHAPSRERQNGCTARCCLCGFQSTLPHGSDAMLLLMLAAAVVISIHAPSRERRPSFITSAPLSMISIHAPLRERRLLFLPALGATTFQSTLPCGSDRLTALDIHSEAHFNPRSLAGAT